MRAELLQKRVRDPTRACGYENRIEGSMFGPTDSPVSDLNRDIITAQLVQDGSGASCHGPNSLDRKDILRQLREHRSLIAGPGSHFQHLLFTSQAQGFR